MPAIATSPTETCCTKCLTALDTEALKCSRCSVLLHLRCSDLPMYMLLRFKTSQAQYICRACVLSEGNPQSLKEAETELEQVLEREKNTVNEAADDSKLSEKSDCESNNHGCVADDHGNQLSVNNQVKIDPSDKDNRPHCRYYLRGNCKHGRKGTKCAYKHPPLCLKYMAKADSNGGCKKGSGCKYVHPRIYWSHKGNKVCSRSNCKFYHIKGTKFEAVNIPQSQQESANQEQKPNKFKNQTSSFRKHQEQYLRNEYSLQLCTENSNHAGNSSGVQQLNHNFLELKMQIATIQEQLKLLMGYRIPQLPQSKQMGWGLQPQ